MGMNGPSPSVSCHLPRMQTRMLVGAWLYKSWDTSINWMARPDVFHECSAVGGEDDANPVEWVGGFGSFDAVDLDLVAYKEDEEG